MIKKTTVTAILAVLLAIAFLPISQLHTVNAKESLNSLHADTERYQVAVSYGKEAGIPEGASLEVREIPEGSDEYFKYLAKSAEEMNFREGKVIETARFFDISIRTKEGAVIEPLAPVQVTITYPEVAEIKETDSVNIVHFADDGVEVIDSTAIRKNGTDLKYEQSGFSVTGTVVARDALEDGEKYVIYASTNNGYFAVSHYSEGRDADLVYGVPINGSTTTGNTVGTEEFGSSIVWTVHSVNVGGTTYYTFSFEEGGNTYYLRSYGGLMVGANDEIDEATYKEESRYRWRYDNDRRLRNQQSQNNNGRYLRYSGSNNGFRERDNNNYSSFYFAKVENYTEDVVVLPTVHYVDESGNELAIVHGRDWTKDQTTSPAYLIYDIDGYDYVKTTFNAVSGDEIRPILQRKAGKWQYTTSTEQSSSITWNNLPENQDIYVVYEKSTEPVTGGTPKVKESSATEDPVDPVIHKESLPNNDGTNKIGLSIIADTSPLEVEKLADVIVIVDTSSSMRRKMGTSTTTYYDNDTPASEQEEEETRLYLAAKSVNALADMLIGEDTTFKDSAGNKLIRMSLISFNSDAAEKCGFTDDVDAYKTKVNALTTNTGTNWEAALELANHMEIDSERATFVIFVTDGNPSYRTSRGNILELEGYPDTVSDKNVDVHSSNSYYMYRINQYFGALDETDARNYNTAVVDAKSIVDHKKTLFCIGIGNTAGVSRLTGLTSAAYGSEEIGKERTKTAENEEELKEAFDDIAASIIALLGWGDIQMTDGITSLANTVEKSGLLDVDGNFEYWKAPAPDGWENMTKAQRKEFLKTYQPAEEDFVKWEEDDRARENCQEATYDTASGSVIWNMGPKFVPESGCTYKVTFRVWPSQEAYDILANLKNGTVSYDSLPVAQKAQIVDLGDGNYSLKTNDKEPETTYKAARKTNDGVTTRGDTKTLKFNDVDPMVLVPEKMTVKKEWDHDMNMSHAADALKFRLLVDGKYYQKDGSLNSDPTNALILDITEEEREKADGTKIPAWSNSVNIAPGIVIFDGTGDSKRTEVYETGHKYQLEEFDLTLDGKPVDAFDGSYEFTTQTVRPMVLTDEENGYHAELIYLILADDDNPVPEGAQTYTIDGETYYIAKENNSTVVGTNHRKAELDITKLINNNSGDPSITTDYLANETFTYRVTLNVPEDADLSMMTAYEWVERPDGTLYYIDGYKESDNPLPGDKTRFSEQKYRWYTVRYPGTDKLEDSFTTEGAGEGRKQLVIDVTLKRDEVLRFTNVPTDTRYTITEVYANYRQANPSKNDDAPGSDKPSNLAEQGYSVTQILSSADEFEVDGNTITGIITEPNKRYYNQFTNTLGNVVEVKLDGVKHLEGYSWSGERYYFNLSGEGNPMPGINGRTRFYLTSESGTADKSYTFGKIRFTEPGTYTYTIAEDDAGTQKMVNGRLITFGAAEEVKITIAKNAADRLYVESVEGIHTTWNAETLTATTKITNKYDFTDVSIDKIWVDNNGQLGQRVAADKFAGYLKLFADGTEVTGVTPTVTVDEEDSNKYIITWMGLPKTVDDVEITYTVQESAITGYTTSYGQEGATSVENGGTITNTYKATGKATLEVTKALAGAEWPEGKTLTFTLSGTGGTLPETKTATLTAAGKATFGDITYTEADAGKTYTYTISEDGFGGAWTGSGAVKATVEVTDNKDGTLGTKVTYLPEDATIINTYKAEGKATLEASKKLTGRDWKEGETFTFTLTGPDGKVEDKTINRDGKIAFSDITYTEADAGKTYEYTISETSELPKGVKKSSDIKAEVTITDKGNGILETSVKYTPEDATIINTYSSEGKATLKVNKDLTGREWQEGETFTFTLTDKKSGAKIEDVPVTKNGEVSFSDITYTEKDAGKTYEYTISETSELPAGVKKSDDITATVKVTDNGDGSLATEVTYTNNATIINTYTAAPVKAKVNVLKNIDGYIEGKDKDGNIVDRTFNFTMTGPKIDGALTTSITTAGGTGTASFSEIEYTFDDMKDETGKRVTEKQFTYEVTETAGSDAGWTYDKNTYKVIVTVTDDQKGHLTVTDITKVDEEGNNVKVINTFKEEEYKVAVNLTKVIDDQSGSAKDAAFTFELCDEEGELVQEKTVTTKNLTGSVDFDTLTFETAGVYNYTLKEVAQTAEGWTFDTSEHNVVITITDNFETAKLEAKVMIDGTETTKLTVTNVYKATPTDATLEVIKTIEDTSGSAPETVFEFTLTAGDNDADIDTPMPTPVTTSVTGEGKASFAPITYEKVGTYNYTVKETAGDGNGWIYDETAYPVKVIVEDAGGHLVATPDYGEETTLTVTNIYDPKDAEVELQARKVVEDLSQSAPKEAQFTFQLLKGEEIVEEVTNGAGFVNFSKLTFAKVGTYNYTIKETGEAPNGWTYDTDPREVEIHVTDGGKGELLAEVKYLTEEGEAVITNVYQAAPVDVDPPVQKIFTGKDSEKFYNKGDFTFRIECVSAPEGVTAPMPKKTEIANVSENEFEGKKGFYEFGVLTFTVAGTYEYKVTESGSVPNVTNDPDAVTGKTLIFKVTDDGEGNLVVDPTSDKAQFLFTNKYDAPKTGDHNNIVLLLVIMGLALAAGGTSLFLLKKKDIKKN